VGGAVGGGGSGRGLRGAGGGGVGGDPPLAWGSGGGRAGFVC